MQEVQEEVSLREVIELVWSGKWLIGIITAVAMAIAGVYSFFVADPEFEATSHVRVTLSGDQATLLPSLIETAKSDVALNRVIEKLDLAETYTLAQLRNAVSVSQVDKTSVVNIKVTGTNNSTITNVANLLAFEMGARTEISDRSSIIVETNKQLQDMEESQAVLESELNEVEYQLTVTPEKLVTNKVVADEAALEAALQQQGVTAGTIAMQSEETNPVYTQLKARLTQVAIDLKKTDSQLSNLQARISENQQIIDTLETQLNNEKLTARQSERLLGGMNAVFVSPAIQPDEPVGPRKVMNVAIAAVLGAMLSVGVVFARYYWKTTPPVKK